MFWLVQVLISTILARKNSRQSLLLLTGIIQKPEIDHYWSTDPLLKSSIFSETMARNRYQTTMEFLHFNGNSNYNPNEPARDKLYKIRPVMEYLVHRFQTMYTPEKNLSIDEELLLFKGRYIFNLTLVWLELIKHLKWSALRK